MSLSTSVATQADRVARRLGYRVFPDWALNPAQLNEIDGRIEAHAQAAVPEEAAGYLQRENPRLLEFRQMYAGLDEELKTPLVWTEKFAAVPDLTSFRGDNMWVHQRGHQHLTERAYLLAVYYILANDRLGLMEKLTEDGAFGAVTFNMAGHRVSRDMMDSILEINFLDRHLQLASRNDLSILDIGAGYGRLAHRMMEAFRSLPTYRCTDAIPESSFVCEYNLKFRGHEGRFQVIPATEIDRALPSAKINLAINIHSFSECTLQAVGWWLDRLAKHGVKHLMIVPNAGNHCGQLLRNNVGQDMMPLVEQRGYRLIGRDSKYLDPEVQKFALNPTCHWLFELGG
jgi:hypothetical protein